MWNRCKSMYMKYNLYFNLVMKRVGNEKSDISIAMFSLTR